MEMFERVSLAAEAAGFEYALVPVTPTCWEAWISTAMMSAKTTKLKMLVAARPGYILPTQMARMIGAFDQLSEGRVYINLIAGGNPRELAGDGITFSHDERYEVMDESVQIMKALWSSHDRIDWEGKHFQLNGAHAYPKPYQDPWPRFYIGGESDAARNVGRSMPTAISSGATRLKQPQRRSWTFKNESGVSAERRSALACVCRSVSAKPKTRPGTRPTA